MFLGKGSAGGEVTALDRSTLNSWTRSSIKLCAVDRSMSLDWIEIYSPLDWLQSKPSLFVNFSIFNTSRERHIQIDFGRSLAVASFCPRGDWLYNIMSIDILYTFRAVSLAAPYDHYGNFLCNERHLIAVNANDCKFDHLIKCMSGLSLVFIRNDTIISYHRFSTQWLDWLVDHSLVGPLWKLDLERPWRLKLFQANEIAHEVDD